MHTMEDAGYLPAFHKQTQSTRSLVPRQLLLLMGMSTPLAGCPEQTFACVPSPLEPVQLLLLGPQASLISELWLMCTSHKTSLLCNLPNHRLSIHHQWRGGW
jgi:hypothetical protein